MQEGQYVAIWLDSGRIVTRWKDARASIAQAVIASSKEEMVAVLTEKLKVNAGSIGIFRFEGAPETSAQTLVKNAQPIGAFAQVLSVEELRAKFEEILKLAEQARSSGPFWAEVFVRPKTRIVDENVRRQLPESRGPSRPPGNFRRD